MMASIKSASFRSSKFLPRRAIASTWTNANPILESGEPGYEEDTGRFKLGDGETAWTDLAYSPPSVGSSSAFRGDYSDQAEYVEGDIVTLDHVGYVLSDPGESIPTPGAADGMVEDGDEYLAAAAQATPFGKTIGALGRAGSKVFLGYGDYNTNTGPVDIGQIDAADLTATPTAAIEDLQTEQIILFRRLSDGRVLAPAVDATGVAGGHYAERSAVGVWAERADRISALALHVFDLVEGPGGVLFACGSAFEGPAESGDSGAAIWKSTDDGATWALDYSIFDANVGETHRFNWLAVVGDTVYARSNQTGAGAAPQMVQWTAVDGWQEIAHALPADLGPGQPFRDGYALPNGHWGYSDYNGPLTYFDGTDATAISVSAVGFDVGDDGALYWLTLLGDLMRMPATGDLIAESIGSVDGDLDDLIGLVALPGEDVFVFGGPDAHVRVYTLGQRNPWRALAPDVLDPATGNVRLSLIPGSPGSPPPGVEVIEIGEDGTAELPGLSGFNPGWSIDTKLYLQGDEAWFLAASSFTARDFAEIWDDDLGAGRNLLEVPAWMTAVPSRLADIDAANKAAYYGTQLVMPDRRIPIKMGGHINGQDLALIEARFPPSIEGSNVSRTLFGSPTNYFYAISFNAFLCWGDLVVYDESFEIAGYRHGLYLDLAYTEPADHLALLDAGSWDTPDGATSTQMTGYLTINETAVALRFPLGDRP